jgi:uncharacterized protein DUF6881
MQHVCVHWRHDQPDEPIWLFGELDDENQEIRTIYIWPDGRHARAVEGVDIGETATSLERFPPPDAIASNPHFERHAISSEAFEAVWQEAARRDILPMPPGPLNEA